MQEEQCSVLSNRDPGGEKCTDAMGDPPGQLEITLQVRWAHCPDTSPKDAANKTSISEGHPWGTGFLAQTLSWAQSEHIYLLPGPEELAKRQGRYTQPQGPLCARSAGETKSVFNPALAQSLTACWLLPLLGQTGLTLWLLENGNCRAAREEAGQGSTGPSALLHARPRPLPGPTMPPALPDGKFSYCLASQARTRVAPG